MAKDYNIERHKMISRSLGLEIEDTPRPTISQIETWTPYIVITTIVALLVFCFHMFFAIVRVDGPSMNNTLEDGQFALLSKKHEIERFDIVVLNERLVDGGESKNIIKRVIGMPGDRITVIKGKLYINNEEYVEPYLSAENIKDFAKVDWDIRVPDNHYFVLGDNRDVSKDSRQVGSFEKSAIKGAAVLFKDHSQAAAK